MRALALALALSVAAAPSARAYQVLHRNEKINLSTMTMSEFVQMIRDEGTFTKAVRRGAYSLVYEAFKISPDIMIAVNHKDEYGHSPLFYAASAGNLEAMEFLESGGADPARAADEKNLPLPSDFRGFHFWVVDGVTGDRAKLARDYATIVPDMEVRRHGTLAAAFAHRCEIEALDVLLAFGAKPPSAGDGYCDYLTVRPQAGTAERAAAVRAELAHPPKSFAAAVKALRFDRLRGSERQALGAGLLRWTQEAAGYASPVLSAGTWPKVEELAKIWIDDDLAVFSGPAPSPESLTQGRYERRADFDKRVAAAQKKYDDAFAAFEAKRKAYPEWRRNAVVEAALSLILGAPRLAAVDYDRERQTFSVRVVSDSPYAPDFSQAFVFQDPVTKDQETFEAGLRKAAPKISFRRSGDGLAVERAEFEIHGKVFAALPGAGPASQPLASFGVGGSAPLPSPLTVVYTGGEEAAPAAVHSDVDDAPAPAAPRPSDFAVVVGIDRYHDSDLPRAKFAERDADAVAANLRSLGVPAENIALLKGSDATSASLKSRLESWLPKNVTADSKVYFYFSGHGAPDPATGRAFLVPWDTAPNYLKETGLALPELYADFGKLNAKQVLIALDSCFSGPAAAALRDGARPLVTVQDAGEPPANVTVLAAAEKDQIARSLDDQGHGAFTYYFLKGIKDGMPDTDVLCGYLYQTVKSAAAKLNGSQDPVCRGFKFKFK